MVIKNLNRLLQLQQKKDNVVSPFLIDFTKCNYIKNVDDKFYLGVRKKLRTVDIDIPYIEKFENKKDFIKSLNNINIVPLKGMYEYENGEMELVINYINVNTLVAAYFNKDEQVILDNMSLNENGIPSNLIALDFVFQNNMTITMNIFKENWSDWRVKYTRI